MVKEKMWKEIELFTGSFLAAVDKEIGLMQSELSSIHLEKARQALADNKYTEARKELLTVAELKGADYNITKQIDSLQKYEDYEKAVDCLKDYGSQQAYRLFLPLAYNNTGGVLDAKRLFRESFEKTMEDMIAKARNQNSIKLYTAVFDSLKEYLSVDKQFILPLVNKWQPDYRDFVKDYYTGNILNYKVISGGSYLKSGSGEAVKVDPFLISPVKCDSYFADIYAYATSKTLSKPDYSFAAFSQSSEFMREITIWLNLRPLTREETEFIECDGWKSIREKETFSPSAANYPVGISQNALCVSLSDIQDESARSYFRGQISEQKAKIARTIAEERLKAYRTGVVSESRKIYLMPALSYMWVFNDWNHPGDIRLYQKRSDLAAGMFIGYNFASDIISEAHPFNGIGLSIRYMIKGTSSNSLYPLKSKVQELDINSYQNSGFEAEFQYRPSFRNKSLVLGLGYSGLKSDYSFRFKAGGLTYSASENTSALTVALGLADHSIKDITVLLFLKSYFSLKSQGQYVLSRNVSGNLIIGLGLEYQIPILKSEPDIY